MIVGWKGTGEYSGKHRRGRGEDKKVYKHFKHVVQKKMSSNEGRETGDNSDIHKYIQVYR